jgi:hypothetical protein
MSLKDELVRRLSTIGSAVQVPERAQAREAHNLFCGAVADECIRQMEWARERFLRIQRVDEAGQALLSNQGQAMDGFTKLAEFTAAAKAPLTIAPEDWKP